MPERSIICRDTNEHPGGIADSQFCFTENPRAIKQVDVLNIVKIVANVESVNQKKMCCRIICTCYPPT